MKKLINIWIYLSMLIVVVVLSFILIFIAKEGISQINFTFLFKSPKGMPIGSNGGIFPAIIGSLLTTFIASIIAGIMGLCTSIFNVFYIKNKTLNNVVCTIVQCISGVPSIILGLFGYAFLVVTLGFGKSVLSASITLAIMIYPYIEVRLEKCFREFQEEYLLSSYSLGVSKEYTIIHLVLNGTKKEIITSITMASGFAMGATAPIMLTGAVVNTHSPESLLDPFMSLPYHLYILMQQGIGIDKAYGTAFVLIILVLIINFLGAILGGLKKDEHFD
ncbi:ABC transporter permease subunit [Clostridium sp. Ade.TY]|uniref:PstA family ABC transporter permease n=1 Tax=Clostridium sp. Ade.TY TaxID=1391647 RepID=UPI00040399D8|nr:ABC transporter permease subunit [Clostridium sp. Ade.TY]